MPDLSEVQVAQAVCLIENGFSYHEVASRLNVSKSVIFRNVKRYRETGSLKRNPGQGRKKVTTQRDDRFVVSYVLKNRSATSIEARNRLLEVRNVRISSKTVRRRLKDSGLKPYRPVRAPLLTRRHRVARVAFARNHINWSEDDWQRVLFTDESRFCLKPDDRRGKVYRRPNERYAQCNIIPRVAYGGGSIMVRGGICLGARTELHVVENGSLTAERYVRDILQEVVVPFVPNIGENFILMQDNARPHTANRVSEYLREAHLNTLDWPACSPDLNPIEHVWDMLGRQLKEKNPSPSNIEELKSALLEAWEQIPQQNIDNVIRSMPRRLNSVLRARGGNTKY